jgi:hypothetical protein
VSFDDDCRDHGPVDGLGTDGADLVARLVAIAAELSASELSVLVLVAERLLQGQRRYGVLNINTDPRDFRREAFEELADAAVYLAAELNRGRP